MKIIDQLNRTLIFETNPVRVISLVPSQTELLIDLGLKNNIVGITKFCKRDKLKITRRNILGGTKKINYDKVKHLNPDIIICNKEENTKEIVNELGKEYFVYVSDIITIEDSFQLIFDIGKIFNANSNAKQLVNNIQSKLNSFNSFIAQQPLKKVAYFIWPKPWMAVAGNNYINTILKLNKFENIFENAPARYLEIYIEYLADLSPELKPEFILLPSEPYPFEKDHIKELQKYIDCKFIFVDGEMFSWYGSTLLKALDYFRELIKDLK